MLNKCCCCIPLRAGVFIISLLSLLASIVSLVALIVRRERILSMTGIEGVDITVNMTVPYYITIGISSMLVLFSIFGLVGSMAQKRGFIQAFRVMYWIFTVLAFILTFGVYIFILVRRGDIQSECVVEMMRDPANDGLLPADTNYTELCNRAMIIALALGGVGVVIGNILSIYFACVVSAYATRLKPSYQHHPLRDLEDFPQASYKTAVY